MIMIACDAAAGESSRKDRPEVAAMERALRDLRPHDASSSSIKMVPVDGVPGAFQLDNVLSPSECERLARAAKMAHASEYARRAQKILDAHASEYARRAQKILDVRASEYDRRAPEYAPRPSTTTVEEEEILGATTAEEEEILRATTTSKQRRSTAAHLKLNVPRRESQHHIPCHVERDCLSLLAKRLSPFLPVVPLDPGVGNKCWAGGGKNAAKKLEAKQFWTSFRLPDSEIDRVSPFLRCYWYRAGEASAPHFDRSMRTYEEESSTSHFDRSTRTSSTYEEEMSTTSYERGGETSGPPVVGSGSGSSGKSATVSTRRVKNLSAFSLLLYVGVSEDMVGGETTFFKNRCCVRAREDEEQLEDKSNVPDLEVVARVAPKLGSALVFPHGSFPGSYPNPFHEGTRVVAGEKVLLRLDVHYDRGCVEKESCGRSSDDLIGR